MDRFGPEAIVLPSLMLLSVGCLGLASLRLAPQLTLLLLASSGLSAGLGYGAIYPALNALALKRLPERARGRAVSLATASIDLGSSSGALVAGFLATELGYSTMFSTMAICVAIAALLFYRTERSHLGKGRPGL